MTDHVAQRRGESPFMPDFAGDVQKLCKADSAIRGAGRRAAWGGSPDRMQQTVAAASGKPKLPDRAVQLAGEVIATDRQETARLAECQRLGGELRAIGAIQDRTLAKCRMDARWLRQQAATMAAGDTAGAALAKKIQARTEQVFAEVIEITCELGGGSATATPTNYTNSGRQCNCHANELIPNSNLGERPCSQSAASRVSLLLSTVLRCRVLSLVAVAAGKPAKPVQQPELRGRARSHGAWAREESPRNQFSVDSAEAADGKKSALLKLGSVESFGVQFGQQVGAPEVGKTYTFAVWRRA